MLHEHRVAADDTDLPVRTVGADGADAEGKGQGVVGGPRDVQDRDPGQRVESRGDLGQPDGLPVGRVGVRGGSGARAQHLLEDDDIAGGEPQNAPWLLLVGPRLVGPRVAQGRGRRAGGQTAGAVPPGPQGDPVVGPAQDDLLVPHRLEHGAPAGPEFPGGDDRPRGPRAPPRRQYGEGQVRARQGHGLLLGLQADEGAGRAAVVHRVVDQPGMPTDRGTQPGGVEIRLGGDGVLLVAQPVPDVGEELHQGDGQIGHMPLGPLRHRQGEPVQQQPTEAGVVLGQIVDGRFRTARSRRTGVGGGRAVQAVRSGVEGELLGGVAGIEAPDQRDQPVDGGVAAPVQSQPQTVRLLLVLLLGLAVRDDVGDLDAGDAPAALDAEGVPVQTRRERPEVRHGQRAPVGADGHRLKAREPLLMYRGPPPLAVADRHPRSRAGAGRRCRHRAVPPSIRTLCWSPVAISR